MIPTENNSMSRFLLEAQYSTTKSITSIKLNLMNHILCRGRRGKMRLLKNNRNNHRPVIRKSPSLIWLREEPIQMNINKVPRHPISNCVRKVLKTKSRKCSTLRKPYYLSRYWTKIWKLKIIKTSTFPVDKPLAINLDKSKFRSCLTNQSTTVPWIRWPFLKVLLKSNRLSLSNKLIILMKLGRSRRSIVVPSQMKHSLILKPPPSMKQDPRESYRVKRLPVTKWAWKARVP